MGRRGFLSTINAIAREAERSQRRHAAGIRRQETAIRRQEREAQRHYKALDKESKRHEKEQKQLYIESRIEEAEDKNEETQDFVKQLEGILDHTLKIDDKIDFDSLKISESFKPKPLPKDLKEEIKKPELKDYLSSVRGKTFFEKLLGSKRFESDSDLANKTYAAKMVEFQELSLARKNQIDVHNIEIQKSRETFEEKKKQRNQEVDELKRSYFDFDEEAVITYNSMVLERSVYPDGFPQEFRLAYNSDSKEILIEYQLPDVEVIPIVSEYKYNKSKDAVEEKSRKKSDIGELYKRVVAATTLRTIHEVCEADQAGALSLVTLNGYLETIDKATGKDIRPFIISVRATKEIFLDIKLNKVDIFACLRNLGAHVSSQPEALVPVKPIVEFNMVDKRYVEQADMIGSLDSRPNLMDLNPSQFENLVSNLFQKMGLESKLTRSSRDGGVDAVAYDSRPVLGGKVVIQAKRYKNTVGVSAIRDLYGTMMNEGANKGIIVSTSSYGPDAYEFSKDKPIELIDGSGLLYLLEQVGYKAQIIIPIE